MAAASRRKPVARKTRGSVYERALLKAQLESSPDAVLVVDPKGRILSYNRRFVELWGIPADVLASRDDGRAIASVLGHLADPEGFRRRVEQIYARPDASSHDEVALKDGRVFERHSAPVRGPKGERYGRVWYFRDVTDRKASERAAEETRRTHESWVRAVAGSSDGLWDWDVVTNQVYFSPRYKEMLGYAVDEVPDRFEGWVELIHPEDRERALEKVKLYQEGLIPVYELEHRLRQKDGSYRWILARGTVLRDATGRLIRMSGSHTDIDARKRVEEEVARLHEDLRRTHESYVRAVAGSTDGLWDINVPAGEAYYSPAYMRMLGYEPGELPGRFDTWVALMHPEERDRALALVKEYDEGRLETWELEHRLRHKDGSYRWILTRGTGLRDADGKILRMSGSHSDIHERKVAELKLRETEQRFRQVTENIREAFWLVAAPAGPDPLLTQIIYISPMWEHIWGRPLPPLDRVTQVWMDSLHPDDRERVLAVGARATEGYEHQYRILRPDGQVRWVRDRAFPVRDGSGAVFRVAGVSEDITERRGLEEELRAARDVALASANAKSEFLANVSHELRTPLNAIIGMNELLLESPLDEAQRERAGVARDAGRGLLLLIDDLLDYSRLEAGRLELDPAPFDPRELVAGVERMLRHKAAEKGLTLSARVAESVPAALMGDEARLRQVLLNYVGNALKFTERGGVEVEAGCAGVVAGRARLRLSVRDTGTGIPPEAQTRLFTAFSQGDASVTKRHGGTGLGLAICRQIAGLMGGSVGVESAPGRGSTFRFDVALPVAPAPAAGSVTRRRADVRGLRVLVVEDNAVNRRVTLSQLSQLGCEAETASDGALGLQALERGGFDVVLMDCAMPVMDGYAAAAELRRREGDGRHVPVIALTAGARPEDRARCLAAGMDDHLAKPVSLDQLAAALSRWGGPLDPAALERALATVGADAGRWRAAYLEDAGRLVTEMCRAAGAGDAEGLRRAAHTLKGASASLGARRLAVLCARVEAGMPPARPEFERELELLRLRLAA